MYKNKVLFLIILLLIISPINIYFNISEPNPLEDSLLNEAIDREFGFETSRYEIIDKRVKRDETFIEILSKYKKNAL